MDKSLISTVDVDQLLLTKRLEPLATEHIETLKHVAEYDVSSFNESEVRSYIIDPILRVLGYDKGTDFSSSHENYLTFLGQLRKSDYHLSLWRENFWLLEAKKPNPHSESFDYAIFAQALEYSVHPSINAALIVLCDGIKLEVFDREDSVDEPILRVRIENLVVDFDKVRAILEPIQIWFFQKRRVLRLLDRVFDKEFNESRVDEFSSLLQKRLDSKSRIIIENFRAAPKGDGKEQLREAQSASLVDLADIWMFFEYPTPVMNAINRRLVELSEPNSFHVLYRVLPEQPRWANENFMAQAVIYLMSLLEKHEGVQYLPSWMTHPPATRGELEPAIRLLLAQCLSYFSEYEPYRVVLLAGCALRRLFKAIATVDGGVRRMSVELHALARHTLPEISWEQVLTSPEGQLIRFVDVESVIELRNFVRRHTIENGFLIESAKIELKNLWQLELKVLQSVDNYARLSRERPLGVTGVAQWASVTYDNLGHITLCLLHRFPAWKDYLLKYQRNLVEDVASTGSWAAREMLGLGQRDIFREMSDEDLANRFFLGQVETLRAIRSAISGT